MGGPGPLEDKLMGNYYGHEDMRIGGAQFATGEILDDGTVSSALLIQKPINNTVKGGSFQSGGKRQVPPKRGIFLEVQDQGVQCGQLEQRRGLHRQAGHHLD